LLFALTSQLHVNCSDVAKRELNLMPTACWLNEPYYRLFVLGFSFGFGFMASQSSRKLRWVAQTISALDETIVDLKAPKGHGRCVDSSRFTR